MPSSAEPFLFGHYDLTLVALAIVSSLLASYAAWSLLERVRDAIGRDWIRWLIVGATVDGVGAWAMHHIGFFAFRAPAAMFFHWPTSLMSFLAAVLGSASAMLVLGKGRVSTLRSVAAGLLLGVVGISSVFYTSMAGLRVPAVHYYNPASVVLAISLAVLIVFASFMLGKLASNAENRAGALLRGTATPVMHFTAMAGTMFVVTIDPVNLSQVVSISSLGILAVSIVPVMVLVVNLMTCLLDKLRKQKALLDELFEQAPEAVALMNQNDRVIRVNREFTRIFGYTEAESLNRHLGDIFDSNYSIRETLSDRAEDIESETIRYHKDGTPLRVSLVRVPVAGTAGQIASYAIYRDMTERKRTEALLQESEQRFFAFMDNIPGNAWIKDLKGRYVYMSKTCAAYTRFPNDWRGRTDDELFPPRVAAQFITSDKQMMTSNRSMRLFESYFSEGKEHYVAVSKFPILDHLDRVVLLGGVSIDVSERLHAEAALKATNEQLRALSGRLQTIREEETTRISRELHDVLGSALTSLKWDLEFMSRKLSEPGRSLERESLNKDLNNMTRMVDTTIDSLRRISSELRPGVLDDLGLDAAIEWQARQFQIRTGIVCQYKIAGKIELTREQSIAVFRILQETLTNVIRHANATRVTIDMKLEGEELLLTITDNGRGISEVEKCGQRAIGILGMRERAHLIGGRLDIKGTNGKGTAVSLKVPLFQNRVSKAG
jgi:two-component system, NarL family, sensor histidine kinase UhpB